MENKGFTLVELLAVIAILAILVIIALPNVLKMFNESKKNSFLTEAKTVYSEAAKKYISDSITSTNNNEHIYCKSKTDSLNPLSLSGRGINYYIKTDSNGNVNTIVVWDDTRYIAKKDSKIDVTSLTESKDITNDIKNATCDNILEASGLVKKIDYNYTSSNLIIDANNKIIIKFSDASDVSSLAKVKYRVYMQSDDDKYYRTEKLLTETDITSTDVNNKFKIELDNPAMIVSPWNYTYRVEVYDDNGNKIIEKSESTMYCFVAGTKVKTENGFKNIEDIKVGEMVYSYNLEKNTLELKKVLNTIKSNTIDTYKVTIGNKEVEMSPRHELYIIDKGWIRAYDLKVGDKLLDINSKEVSITKIEYKKYDKPIDTYNLTVEGNSNYFVTNIQVLVHNASPV